MPEPDPKDEEDGRRLEVWSGAWSALAPLFARWCERESHTDERIERALIEAEAAEIRRLVFEEGQREPAIGQAFRAVWDEFVAEPGARPETDETVVWKAAADTGAIMQFHMHPHHAEPLHRMAARHPRVRVIVDHIGKPDVTEAAPYRSFEPVLKLADLPNVSVKIGNYQIASKQEFPWRDTWPFVALLKERFGVERMMWGTGYPRTARIVPLEKALAYVRGLPCWEPGDLEQVLGETPRQLFGF